MGSLPFGLGATQLTDTPILIQLPRLSRRAGGSVRKEGYDFDSDEAHQRSRDSFPSNSWGTAANMLDTGRTPAIMLFIRLST